MSMDQGRVDKIISVLLTCLDKLIKEDGTWVEKKTRIEQHLMESEDAAGDWEEFMAWWHPFDEDPE